MPEPTPLPALTGILETALHVDDLERSVAFYERLFGFPKMVSDSRLCAFDVLGRQVLLLFQRGGTPETLVLPGGTIPPHGSSGCLHFAFSIPPEALEPWRQRLIEQGIEIIGEMQWERGGRSLYFHDPDGHLVELLTPGVWANY